MLDQVSSDLYDTIKFKGRGKYSDREIHFSDLLEDYHTIFDEVCWRKNYVELWMKQTFWKEKAENGEHYWDVIDPLNLGLR